MIAPNAKQLIAVMEALGHAVFTDGAYNLNIVGLRNATAFDVEEYNDLICCMYRETRRSPLIVKSWPGTTDPGRKARAREDFRTAVLVPGQYRGSYRIGEHKGRQALVQAGGPVTVHRAAPGDLWPFSECNRETGYFGINIHDMLNARSVVSSGCQGCHMRTDHDELMALARRSEDLYGPNFTYTLLDWN